MSLQDKIHLLQQQNAILRRKLLLNQDSLSPLQQHYYQAKHVDIRNRIIEKECRKLQGSMRLDLGKYMADSAVRSECGYRDKYVRSLKRVLQRPPRTPPRTPR